MIIRVLLPNFVLHFSPSGIFFVQRCLRVIFFSYFCSILNKSTSQPNRKIMKQNILAISGKPGLFLMLARGGNTIIVETLDQQKKRFNVGARDRITSLNDVSIYTDDGDDIKLMKVFESMKEHEQGKAVAIDVKKATKEQLAEYVGQVLPNFDRDRVYPNDMRKLISWYNILVENGFTDFVDPEETAEAAE